MIGLADQVDLYTYSSVEVELDEGDATFLRVQAPRRVRIARDPTMQIFSLDPRQYVGVVALPSGRRLVCHPSMSDHAVIAMLALATDMPVQLQSAIANYATLDWIVDLLAEYFAALVEERLLEGLHREYRQQEDNLRTLRGRIDFRQDLLRNAVLRHRVYCHFSEYTWDIPDNQILSQVAGMLGAWPLRDRAVRARIAQLRLQLAELSPTNLGGEGVRAFTYSRLNEAYRPLHRLCAMLLDQAGISEAQGQVPFRTFLIDMNRLFEVFVGQGLQRSLAGRLDVKSQVSIEMDGEGYVAMRPDLVFQRSGQCVAAGDTKYKRLGEGEFKNHDHYQMLAYCTALGAGTGILIYPQSEVNSDTVLRVSNTRIAIYTLSLAVSGGPAQLLAAVENLARRVAAVSAPPVRMATL